jgi:predicted TIM-barrel fold metal-dependent hydrolase
MDSVGVSRAVLVPPTFAGNSNSLVIAAALEHPDRFAVMATVGLDQAEGAESLSRLRAEPAVLGVRLVFNQGAAGARLLDPSTEWLWAQSEEAGVPVMVFAPGRLAQLAEIARRHPGLRLVIDHLGLHSDLRDAEIAPVIQQALGLARFPNVAVKATSLPSYVTEGYPFRSLHEPLRLVIGEFGPRRVFWGSDLSRLPCPYGELVTLFTDELNFLSADDLAWIMGRAVSEWLNWPVRDSVSHRAG